MEISAFVSKIAIPKVILIISIIGLVTEFIASFLMLSYTKEKNNWIYKRRGLILAIIELNNITKKYGNKKVLDKFSLNIDKEEMVAIMGPSG